MATKKKLLEAAAGAAGGGGGLNVEDVFSTYLYEGNSSTQTITNGIDLDGEGGLVWTKGRTTSFDNRLQDTETGLPNLLYSNSTLANITDSTGITSFNTDGYSLGSSIGFNRTNDNYASWTFRKAPKFFDVVTYTGNGTNQTISHNLGSVPGMIIVKRLDFSGSWITYHRGTSGSPQNDYMVLQLSQGVNTWTDWNQTAPTSTEFSVGSAYTNKNNASFVAYLFAHNDGDGEFGSEADADIIKCGSYTGNGSSTGPEINLGFEPQWLLIKGTSSSDSWAIFDVMRGMTVGASDSYLFPNSSGAELSYSSIVKPTPTGFQLESVNWNTNGNNYIYIAIRRGPMAVPTDATDVFAMDTLGGTSPTPPAWNSGFPVDMGIYRLRNSTSNFILNSRLNQGRRLMTNATDAESGESAAQFDYMNGYYDSPSASTNYIDWMWKRAPNYFDVVAYTGNGTAGRTVSHNLGVAPEMMWVKGRDAVTNWYVYHKDLTNDVDNWLKLNGTDAEQTNTGIWNTSPTATDFYLWNGRPNNSGEDYIAYLFASLDGVSKVFSVTKSSGSDASVNCGFSAGPRFVLLKRTDSTGDWYVWDSERGIVSGNDPYLLLNSRAAEVTSTDYIDPTSNGFTIVNGGLADGDYIGYAVA